MLISPLTKKYLDEDAELIGNVQHLAELPVVISHAQGPFFYDVDGKEYLDFISSACTQNLGFNTTNLSGESFGTFPFPYAVGTSQLEYAKSLLQKFPSKKKAKISFGVCGSESIDAAIKYCRAFTGRQKIVSFYGDYHGTTFGSATLTTMPGRLSNHIGPMLPECYSIAFCGYKATKEEIDATLKALDALNLDEIAGIIVESIQGDMGMIPMHQDLINAIYKRTRVHGIVFVSDEVQLSFYRTGPFYSIENFKIEPDLVTMGKNMGGGVPLSCVIGRSEIMDSLKRLEHAFTFAGNAEGCTRGYENFKVIEKLHTDGHIKALEIKLKERLEKIVKSHPLSVLGYSGCVLAYGLWIKSKDSHLSDNKACFKVMWSLFTQGLYTQRLGMNFLRIQPQLNLSLELLDKAMDMFECAITNYEHDLITDECLEYFIP